jgi:hypothetical protein
MTSKPSSSRVAVRISCASGWRRVRHPARAGGRFDGAPSTFELRDSGPVLVKTLDYLFVDDKVGKPVGIHQTKHPKNGTAKP